MNGFLKVKVLAGKNGEGSEVYVERGFNPMLITHYETTPAGGALLFMMGGAQVALDKDQWDSAGKQLSPRSEPSGGSAQSPMI